MHALLIVKLELDSFIVTLGTMLVVRGAAKGFAEELGGPGAEGTAVNVALEAVRPTVASREPRQQPWTTTIDGSFLRVGAMIEGETWPGREVQTDDQIIAAARQDGACMHTVGTCRMGVDAQAVLDPRLRVRGVAGLRVVDCSAMPTQVSGNTNGPVMALAWRAADLILEDAQD